VREKKLHRIKNVTIIYIERQFGSKAVQYGCENKHSARSTKRRCPRFIEALMCAIA
jgi:hypothetical protein